MVFVRLLCKARRRSSTLPSKAVANVSPASPTPFPLLSSLPHLFTQSLNSRLVLADSRSAFFLMDFLLQKNRVVIADEPESGLAVDGLRGLGLFVHQNADRLCPFQEGAAQL